MNHKHQHSPGVITHSHDDFVTPFGTVLGSYEGVEAFSNGSDKYFSREQNFSEEVFTGIKYQCVEYARRWLIQVKGLSFHSIPMAADIWTLKYFTQLKTDKLIPLYKFPNGSPTPPKEGTVLIWHRNEDCPPGHVAIIAGVHADAEGGYVRVAEQNLENDYWPGNYARELPLVYKEGGYYIEDEDPIIGWMEVDEAKLADDTQIELESLVNKVVFHPKIHEDNWVDLSEPSEKYWAEVWGVSHLKDGELTCSYYSIDESFADKIKYATLEINRMCYFSVEAVIQSDELLEKFGLPKEIWPLIRHSWNSSDGDGNMMGRYDLAFDAKSLKVLEFNGECPAIILETAVIQDKWAYSVGCDIGTSAGEPLHNMLKEYWISQNVTHRVHICIDSDPEEIYNALYMQRIMREAGIESRVAINNQGLEWRNGKIFDEDGVEVKLVWKLWNWETAITDYLDDLKNPQPKEGKPRLSHVLFHSDIRVIEPLWKVISSNKAILAVMWQRYKNHPYLLRTEFELTDELASRPFVKKPIVGRCGSNVQIFKTKDEILEEKNGEFENRDCVYQEAFELPSFEGYYPIIGSWIVNRRFGFGGFGIREDKTLITGVDSPFACCRIISN